MRHITTALAVLAATAGLAACTDSAPETAPATSTTTPATTSSLDGSLAPSKIWEREHTLRNGQVVVCLSTTAGGLDCNWNGLEYGGTK